MRKVALVLTLCLTFILSGCFEENALSVMGNPESDGLVAVRAETKVDDFEIGATMYYGPSESTTIVTRNKRGKDDRRSHGKTITHEHEDEWTYGAHLVWNAPAIGPVTPYGGAQATIGNGSVDFGDDIQPIAGARLGPFVAEWQRESPNGKKDKTFFGLRHVIKW